jgi:hypothetical protein
MPATAQFRIFCPNYQETMIKVPGTIISPVIMFGCEQRNTCVQEQGVEQILKQRWGNDIKICLKIW